jgi:hypothetical protein
MWAGPLHSSVAHGATRHSPLTHSRPSDIRLAAHIVVVPPVGSCGLRLRFHTLPDRIRCGGVSAITLCGAIECLSSTDRSRSSLAGKAFRCRDDSSP